MTENDTVWCVWKIPEEPRAVQSNYSEFGVYPSGELMAVCATEGDADRFIKHCKQFSPSERFGHSENPEENSMDEAPYVFTKSSRDIMEF